jgi:integrase
LTPTPGRGRARALRQQTRRRLRTPGKKYELRQGKYQEASNFTWKEFRQRYEEDYLPNCRPRTRDKVASVFAVFEAICNPRQLRSINERMLSLFVTGMRNRKGRGTPHMAPYSIKVYLNFLHGALNWAVREKILVQCPKFPAIKVPKKKPQPVPTETFECLLSKASDAQMRAFMLCGWLGGLRLNEAFELERGQSEDAPWIDTGRKRIWLPANFTKAVEDQWVPLDPVLQEILEALPRNGRKVFRFESKKDGHLVRVATVSHRIAALAKKAGVKLTMKVLRRGFGCYHAQHVSAHVLQKLLRHANIQTTLDYYANFDPAVEEAIFSRPECNALRNNAGACDRANDHKQLD